MKAAGTFEKRARCLSRLKCRETVVRRVVLWNEEEA